MKLSEAIRAGCLMKPVQGFGSQSIETTQDKVCVLGAAGCGAGMDNPNQHSAFGQLKARFPILKEPVATLPESTITQYTGSRSVCTCMWILNDIFKWPREKIADWIEEVEQEIEECGLKKGQ